MKITIEKRINKDGDKQNIRLVYWYGSKTDENGKIKHNRKLEQLDLYLYADPKTKPEKTHNKQTLQTVEQIKAKRIAEAASGQHGFTDVAKVSANFYSFFKQIMDTKKTNGSSKNHEGWEACLIHLKRHQPDESITFDQVTKEWLEGVKHYLSNEAKKRR